MPTTSLTAFAEGRIVTTGSPHQVTSTVKRMLADGDPRTVLVFDDATGEQVDLDLRADAAFGGDSGDAPGDRRPGRPKLGVVGREVTLLPRHWEWLSTQPGGASVTLRKLVERARRESADRDRVRASQEAAFRFMTALAGDEAGFEEACRALFADDRTLFEELSGAWPGDVRDYARGLAMGSFGESKDT